MSEPRDPRNVWRVIDALGVWREVASEGNAQGKAAAFDRVCPARECPHRVERWSGSEWVPARFATIAIDEDDQRVVCCEACGSPNLNFDGWDIDKCRDCGHWRHH